MINLSLTEKEVSVLEMSIKHCLETCRGGGPKNGCRDCETLKNVAQKISLKNTPTAK